MTTDRRPLRIRLFGDMELTMSSEVVAEFPTRKSAALLAKLVLDGARLSTRDALAELFWDDLTPDKARCCLRTELWRIRRVLEPEGVASGTYLLVRKNGVGFNPTADYELDVAQFEHRMNTLRQREAARLSNDECDSLRKCIALYRGDLLETVDAQWCTPRREALRLQYMAGLELLMRYHEDHCEWDLAGSYGQRLLSLDPLQEHIHLKLMRCHYLKGNRPAAINQYVRCRRILREELGVSPMQETERAYRAMLSRQPPTASGPVGLVGVAEPMQQQVR